MDPLEISSTYWLSKPQQETFDQLAGPLKDTLAQCFAQMEVSYIDIAGIALDILELYGRWDEASRKKSERFFLCLFNNINLQTQPTLNKVLEVAQKGFFEDLLINIDTKKKRYHSMQALISMIDQFYSQMLPILIKNKEDHQILVSHDTKGAFSDSVKQAYEALNQCHTYFALPKLANEFLSFLSLNQKWKEETYHYFFYALNIQYNLTFDDSEKLKLCKIMFSLHSPKRKTPFEYCSESDIGQFLTLCDELKKKGGEEVLGYYFTSLLRTPEFTLNKGLKALKLLLSKVEEKNFYQIVNRWIKRFDFEDLFKCFGNGQAEELNLSSFQDNIQNRLVRFKQDPTITQPLSDDALRRVEQQYKTIHQFCNEYGSLEFNQLVNLAHSIRELAKQGSIHETDHLKLIAIGRLIMLLECGVYPYSTQILALLGLCLDGKHRQGQVRTGEGKSAIIALWAFVMAMECRAVDIITSARSLAVRDHDKFAKFFQRCGITTSHICYDRKIPEYFTAQILYAPAFDFEFAWMEDRLWGAKLYEKRLENPYITGNFDVVMVDESDNLLIDSARNGARLGCPAEISYEWVYAPILSFVRQNKEDVESDKDKIISPLRLFLSQDITEQKQRDLHQLSDEQLKIWLGSAYHTLYELELEKQYVIKEKRTDKGHLKRTIQIVDLQTGRISENSRWTKGIHEFLEVKHDIPVEKESLTPLSLSHAVFYKFYKTIIALTGTAERLQTKEIYEIETFDVPPHHPLKRIDLPIIIAPTTNDYHRLIVQDIKEKRAHGRPSLVLCFTIKETRDLAALLNRNGIETQILNEVQQEAEHLILAQAGVSGVVTVATNTAGRGTDILLTQESLNHGGLHVLLTFYPNSKRVEEQAIGRAGRQGQPGSSRIILNRESSEIKDLIDSDKRQLSDSAIIDLLSKQRELKEKSLAKVQISRAELERFLAEKTKLFFESFRDWVNYVDQDLTLEKYAKRLCSIRLAPGKKLDFSSLNSVDLPLAEECKCLLMRKSEMLSWKILLRKVVERLKKKVIQEWVKVFFEPTEARLMDTVLVLNLLKSQFDQTSRLNLESSDDQPDAEFDLFDFLAKYFLKQIEEQIQLTKAEVNKDFNTYKQEWEKYLNKDGSGLFVYLKEITTVNLSAIFENKS